MKSNKRQSIVDPPSVLIVDDNGRNIQVLAAVLDKAGYNVAAASNGHQALDMIAAVAPDLILLDVMMPGMDGFEVCCRIKASPAQADIPVIMLTALSDPQDMAAGFQSGAVDYVTKPFNKKELLARVGTHLRLKTARVTRNQKIAQLKNSRSQIHALSGLLPICTQCKKIRSDEGYWQQLEVYVSQHSDALFSHGVCPECMLEHYPQLNLNTKSETARGGPIKPTSDGEASRSEDARDHQPTILIVDDNPLNIQVVGKILDKCAYGVTAALDGRQALTIIDETLPDLVLLDLIMPEMGGLEVCRTLKTAPHTAHIPIIILSAKNDYDDIAKGYEAGAEDYVTKPFNPTELLARVNAHMEIKRFGDEQTVLIRKLESALARVKKLANLIPICAHCRKVRIDERYWEQAERYISSHSKVQFSHSLCPDCRSFC